MEGFTYVRLPGYGGGTIEFYQDDVIRDEDGTATYLEGAYTTSEGNSFWGRLRFEDGRPIELEIVNTDGHTIGYRYF